MSERLFDLRLLDILDATERIQQYIEGVAEAEFLENRLLIDAVVYNLIQIGEAVANLPQDFKDAHDEIPWSKIKRMRDFAAHQYFRLSPSIVWETIGSALPELVSLICETVATRSQSDTDDSERSDSGSSA
ncbi:HepT-like ribonuclease domain-containing protein [Gloeobacter violaceus]|uniref:Glr1165 protein n=1 Tax=Gloeobacter violaceus (strain ATCC 29082 / PCC 7421) TaxID=251221 RepID=Q7NLF9_GLOVI|nr:DUF86 domain-containing protein [Gloeobacter violaceus]BAC89106.1 glr1165 [Gloeobacter violaceus PCC 7421]